MSRAKTTIQNKLGLHARAAARFVQVASECDSDIQIYANGKQADGRSIMELMMLAVSKGSEVEIRASGRDSIQAVKRLSALIQERFGEEE